MITMKRSKNVSAANNKIVMKLKEELEQLQKTIEDMGKTKIIQTDTKTEVITLDSKSYMESLDRLREELLKTLATKDDLQALTKRVESLESLAEGLSKEQERTNKEIDTINERLKALEKQLADKVSCEQYDNLLALINQLRSTGDNKDELKPIGPIISSKDLNLLREIAGKFGDLETRVNTLAK